MGGDGSGGGEGVLKAKSNRVIDKSDGDELSLETIEEEEDVPIVDGVLNDALGTSSDIGAPFIDKRVATWLIRRRSVMEGEGGRSEMTTLFDTSVFTDFSFLDESERTHDSINNIILAIVEIRVPLHDLSKQDTIGAGLRYGMDRMALDRPLRRQVTIRW
nr:hypothetical protein [Tanacetum cinerariifolium]